MPSAHRFLASSIPGPRDLTLEYFAGSRQQRLIGNTVRMDRTVEGKLRSLARSACIARVLSFPPQTCEMKRFLPLLSDLKSSKRKPVHKRHASLRESPDLGLDGEDAEVVGDDAWRARPDDALVELLHHRILLGSQAQSIARVGPGDGEEVTAGEKMERVAGRCETRDEIIRPFCSSREDD